jgi:hypothetical protein
MSKPEIEVTFDEHQTPQPAAQPRVRQISGLIETVDTEPTGVPRSFAEQFKIFDGALWYYDGKNNVWLNVGALSAGSDEQIIFNNGGTLTGSVKFRIYVLGGEDTLQVTNAQFVVAGDGSDDFVIEPGLGFTFMGGIGDLRIDVNG